MIDQEIREIISSEYTRALDILKSSKTSWKRAPNAPGKGKDRRRGDQSADGLNDMEKNHSARG